LKIKRRRVSMNHSVQYYYAYKPLNDDNNASPLRVRRFIRVLCAIDSHALRRTRNRSRTHRRRKGALGRDVYGQRVASAWRLPGGPRGATNTSLPSSSPLSFIEFTVAVTSFTPPSSQLYATVDDGVTMCINYIIRFYILYVYIYA